LAKAADVVGAAQWTSGALLRRARNATVAVAETVGSGFVADGATEVLESDQVALTGEEQARSAVVPDRARFFATVAGFDLGQVVETKQELDTLPWTA
jgi:hypothetical protein